MRSGFFVHCLPFSVYCFLVITCTPALAVAPTVSGVVAHQRTDGSKIVDIYYDLADPDTQTLSVSVKASSDGGATYGVAIASLSGDTGPNVSRGTGKHIVWDSAKDLAAGTYGTNYKICVTAYDSGVYPGQMVTIPAGSFLMGNNGSERDRYPDDALPQHSVYLSAYRIGKYEVTRGEYAQFMAAGGYSNPAYWSAEGWSWRVSSSRTEPDYWAAQQNWGTGAFTQTDNHPVVGVFYHEAEAYCNWAGGHLPTEAQWEKAARWTGSHPRVYPWGDGWDGEKCNNMEDHNSAGGGYGKEQTAPVGSYPAGMSPYGLHDMAGNVWEYCQDRFSPYYYSQTPPGGWVDPQGPSTGSRGVVRGGAYYGDGCCYDWVILCSFRWHNSRGGFRICR